MTWVTVFYNILNAINIEFVKFLYSEFALQRKKSISLGMLAMFFFKSEN